MVTNRLCFALISGMITKITNQTIVTMATITMATNRYLMAITMTYVAIVTNQWPITMDY